MDNVPCRVSYDELMHDLGSHDMTEEDIRREDEEILERKLKDFELFQDFFCYGESSDENIKMLFKKFHQSLIDLDYCEAGRLAAEIHIRQCRSVPYDNYREW